MSLDHKTLLERRLESFLRPKKFIISIRRCIRKEIHDCNKICDIYVCVMWNIVSLIMTPLIIMIIALVILIVWSFLIFWQYFSEDSLRKILSCVKTLERLTFIFFMERKSSKSLPPPQGLIPPLDYSILFIRYSLQMNLAFSNNLPNYFWFFSNFLGFLNLLQIFIETVSHLQFLGKNWKDPSYIR